MENVKNPVFDKGFASAADVKVGEVCRGLGDKKNTKSYRALTRRRHHGAGAKKIRIWSGNFAIMVEIFIKRIYNIILSNCVVF